MVRIYFMLLAIACGILPSQASAQTIDKDAVAMAYNEWQQLEQDNAQLQAYTASLSQNSWDAYCKILFLAYVGVQGYHSKVLDSTTSWKKYLMPSCLAAVGVGVTHELYTIVNNIVERIKLHGPVHDIEAALKSARYQINMIEQLAQQGQGSAMADQSFASTEEQESVREEAADVVLDCE